jgi:hypothetical protein
MLNGNEEVSCGIHKLSQKLAHGAGRFLIANLLFVKRPACGQLTRHSEKD